MFALLINCVPQLPEGPLGVLLTVVLLALSVPLMVPLLFAGATLLLIGAVSVGKLVSHEPRSRRRHAGSLSR